MANYPSPCDTCHHAKCMEKKCEPWRTRYMYRQKQINAYAKMTFPEIYSQKKKEGHNV